MQNLAFILKGVAIVFVVQMQTLEGDTKNLLSQINGDAAWNYINKNKKAALESPVKNKKRKGDGIKEASHGVRAFNALDAKQILEFTKDRLQFLSSNYQDKLQLRSLDDGNSAIKDF